MQLTKLPETCHCGLPMHLSENHKWLIKHFGARWPMYKKVIWMPTKKAYAIPSYYLLVHTITGKDPGTLGFGEWDAPNTVQLRAQI